MVYHAGVRIEVLCFAAARDAVGAPRLEIELGAGSTVESALAALVARHPALRPLVPRLRCAVNEEFATGARALQEGDTLAVIPPVSGG
jgi:molybdopterin synthase sulfur carrier subunit